jgi:hypothetical protein
MFCTICLSDASLASFSAFSTLTWLWQVGLDKEEEEVGRGPNQACNKCNYYELTILNERCAEVFMYLSCRVPPPTTYAAGTLKCTDLGSFTSVLWIFFSSLVYQSYRTSNQYGYNKWQIHIEICTYKLLAASSAPYSVGIQMSKWWRCWKALRYCELCCNL